VSTTITLIPTRFYLTGSVYDGAGNVMCALCGVFYAPRGGHYCAAMTGAIPMTGGGFVVPSSPQGANDANGGGR
jgi:hypothetical protein